MLDRRALWLVLLAAALMPYFVNLGATSIIDANEAFYTETPREMIEAGDYLNSTFNYEPRFNKPPLSYWIVAGFYQAFGMSLSSARLPIAIGALVMIGTAYALGRVAFSPGAGWLAAITLAATPRFLLFARRIMIDVYSSMFLGLTLLFFVLAETDPPRRRRWLVVMYVAAALGVLTKGPVAIVIPALVFPVYLVATGRLATIRTLMLPAGALVGAVIVLPYYVALYVEHGWGHITTFLVQENVARFAEGVGAPDRGPLFYLPVVFADLYFPWSLLLPVALALVPWRRVWRASGGRPSAGPAPDIPVTAGDVRLLLGLWIVLIVAFYSASRAQQDLYVLPFVPAGAALVGGLLNGFTGGTLAPGLWRWTRGGLGVTMVVLALLGALGAWFMAGGDDNPIHLAGIGTAGIGLTMGSVGALVLLVRRRPNAALGTVVASAVFVMWLVVIVVLPDFERYKPVPHLARAIGAVDPPVARVATYRYATPSLVFYLRRHVDELLDERQLVEFFARDPGGYCVMRAEDYPAVQRALGAPMKVVADAPRFDIKLPDLLARTALPRLVLVTGG